MDIRTEGSEVRIPLTRGYYALVNSEDFELVSTYKWFADIRKNGKVYAAATVYVNGKKTSLRMHCLILGTAGSGHFRIGEHANGNGIDNRRTNLRPASQLENMRNRGPQSGRKFKGVTRQKRLTKRPWQARIHRNGITKHLGYFPTEEEAALAYNRYAEMSDQEFLRANEVDALVCLSDNLLREILSKESGTDHDGKRVVIAILSCGHHITRPWWRRSKLGKTHHCAECA